MSKQTDEFNNLINEADSYDDEQLEFVDLDDQADELEPLEPPKTEEPELGEPQGVIQDDGEGTAFVADWDTIEKNYQEKHFGSERSHHSHRHHHHHHHSSSDSGDSSKSEHSHHSSHSSGDGSKSEHSSSGSHRHHSSSHSSRRHSSSKKGSRRKDKEPRKKWSKKKKIIVSIVAFLLCIIIGSIGALLFLRWQGKQEFTNYDQLNLNLPDWVKYRDGGFYIYYKGHEYTFNKNIATVLFMGVDNRELKTNAKMGTAGQADAIYLFTFNVVTDEMKILCLNRDTMTDISRYDVEGNYIDTKKTQLCLAYAFGDGKKTSAENEKTAVQRLIYNIPLYTYYAIDLSAIKILNDDVGGVPVTPQFNFREFKKGVPVVLKGNQAETFVRHRDIRLMDDNLRRIECQKQYIQKFAERVVPATRSNLNTPSKLYNHSQRYTVSNLDAPKLVYLATDLSFGFRGFTMLNTQGTYKKVKDDSSAEYFLKEVPFFETILDIFYTQTG